MRTTTNTKRKSQQKYANVKYVYEREHTNNTTIKFNSFFFCFDFLVKTCNYLIYFKLLDSLSNYSQKRIIYSAPNNNNMQGTPYSPSNF